MRFRDKSRKKGFDVWTIELHEVIIMRIATRLKRTRIYLFVRHTSVMDAGDSCNTSALKYVRHAFRELQEAVLYHYSLLAFIGLTYKYHSLRKRLNKTVTKSPKVNWFRGRKNILCKLYHRMAERLWFNSRSFIQYAPGPHLLIYEMPQSCAYFIPYTNTCTSFIWHKQNDS
jgi:hypothetical protein